MAAPKDPQELIRPARDGALRVLRAARDAGVPRTVMTSSCAAIAYGYPQQPAVLTEENWSNPDYTEQLTQRPGLKLHEFSSLDRKRFIWPEFEAHS